MLPRTSTTHRTRLGAVFCAAVLAIPLVGSAAAGAAESCGDISFGFSGTRLLNDGISNTAGPFPAEIPAGTYTVTLVSHDTHSSQADIASQTGEQFRVMLDSGYASPVSTDIPDDEDTTTTVFTGQQIDASSAISVHHGGLPGINSVDVVCVGFTAELPAADDLAEEDPTVEFLDDPGVLTNPEVPESDIGEPAEVANPNVAEVDIGEPAAVANPNAPAAIDEAVGDQTPEVDVQVAGIQLTDDNAPMLAITGPSPATILMTAIATLLILVGSLLVRREWVSTERS